MKARARALLSAGMLLLMLWLAPLPEARAQAFTTSEVAEIRKEGSGQVSANWISLFGNFAVDLSAPLIISDDFLPCAAAVVTPNSPVPGVDARDRALEISFIFHKSKDNDFIESSNPVLRIETVNKTGERFYTVAFNAPGLEKFDQPGDFKFVRFDTRQLNRVGLNESFGSVKRVAVVAICNGSGLKGLNGAFAHFQCLKVRFNETLPERISTTVQDGGSDALLNFHNIGFVLGTFKP